MDKDKPVVIAVLDNDEIYCTVAKGQVNVITVDYELLDGHAAAAVLAEINEVGNFTTPTLAIITKLNDIMKEDEDYQDFLADSASDDEVGDDDEDYDDDDDDVGIEFFDDEDEDELDNDDEDVAEEVFDGDEERNAKANKPEAGDNE